MVVTLSKFNPFVVLGLLWVDNSTSVQSSSFLTHTILHGSLVINWRSNPFRIEPMCSVIPANTMIFFTLLMSTGHISPHRYPRLRLMGRSPPNLLSSWLYELFPSRLSFPHGPSLSEFASLPFSTRKFHTESLRF